jgi:CO dehydrogenase/acetyl-CoA synthase epsilon subunit
MDKVAFYKRQIYKRAAINADVKLYPHQQRVVDDPSTSKILAHEVGSGKTLTSIAKFEKMKEQGKAKKALVVVPASLRENFGKHGVGKFTNSKYNIVGTTQERMKKTHKGIDSSADYNIVSYDLFKKDPERYLKESGADTVISDESHRSKNEGTQVTNSLKRSRKLYKNYIGLTGSVVSNSISDVQPLVDVSANRQHTLGKNKNEFDKAWLRRSSKKEYAHLPEKRRPVVGFKNKELLKKELAKHIDYVDYDDVKHFAKMPSKDLSVVKVPINSQQAKLYKKLLKNDPAVRNLIKMKRLETLKDEEAAQAFSKLIEARKLMNSVGSATPKMTDRESSRVTPKTRKLLDDLQSHLTQSKQGRALLFSHLINGGTDVLEAGLKERKIPYGKFIGKGNKGITEASRQADVEDYNKGKKKVMLISSAGGEGLSLNDTTWEGVLDPHYNPEKMKQMEARGIRSGGLSKLPKEQRRVKVNRYLSTMPKTLGIFPSSYKTPDEFIYEISQNKNKQNERLYKLLKESRKTSRE